ncbi:MAG TPA: phage portal protein [Gemmataceae bacterium]|nr:phage portal protein [Gemmataceae bacterium]
MTGLPPETFEHLRRGGGNGNPAGAIVADPQVTGTTLVNPAPWFVDWLTGRLPGEQGPVVNEHTALNYSALYSCVSLIAGTIASLPLKVYRSRSGKDGGQDEVPERPEYDLLQSEFNPNTSAMSGRETGLGHLLTWGNSYCQIVKNRLGEVLRLQPLGPDIVCPETNGRGELEYEVYDRQTGQVIETLPRDEVLHVPGLSFDAMCGYSMVRVARHTIRTGVAQDREAERFITRGIRPPGAVKFPPGKKFADEKAALRFRDSFRRLHSSEEGSLNVIILEDGADWQSLGVDPESAQLLESRKFTALEICGIYHVPPHMVGLVEKTTGWGTGIEELTIGFVVYCLLPIIRRIEQEYNRKLFRADRSLFCEHVLSGLLRGDALKRAQALEIMCRNGIITVNEWRRLEGMNPLPGGGVRYFPLNMGRVDEEGNDIAPPPPAGMEGTAGQQPAPNPGSPARSPGQLAASLRSGMVAAVGRCLRKEAAEALKAAKKPGGFVAWVEEFYGRHGGMLADHTRALIEAWSAAFGTDPWGGAEAFAEQHLADSKNALLAAAEVPADRLADSVESVVSRWQSERLAAIAGELQPGGLAHAL